jgi:membrane protease YdiL (CAAX protease family)
LEEIVFRGFLFRLFSKIIGTWGALLLTAALFGAAHAGNRGATVWSSLAIAVEAGILLGAAYASTQRLWLPIGLHAGWNFCEGSIFGMAVSGHTMRPGLILGTLSGHPSLTGGAFGPESSIVAVLLCFAVAVFFLWWMVKMKRVEPAAWSGGLKTQSVAP